MYESYPRVHEFNQGYVEENFTKMNYCDCARVVNKNISRKVAHNEWVNLTKGAIICSEMQNFCSLEAQAFIDGEILFRCDWDGKTVRLQNLDKQDC